MKCGDLPVRSVVRAVDFLLAEVPRCLFVEAEDDCLQPPKSRTDERFGEDASGLLWVMTPSTTACRSIARRVAGYRRPPRANQELSWIRGPMVSLG